MNDILGIYQDNSKSLSGLKTINSDELNTYSLYSNTIIATTSIQGVNVSFFKFLDATSSIQTQLNSLSGSIVSGGVTLLYLQTNYTDNTDLSTNYVTNKNLTTNYTNSIDLSNNYVTIKKVNSDFVNYTYLSLYYTNNTDLISTYATNANLSANFVNYTFLGANYTNNTDLSNNYISNSSLNTALIPITGLSYNSVKLLSTFTTTISTPTILISGNIFDKNNKSSDATFLTGLTSNIQSQLNGLSNNFKNYCSSSSYNDLNTKVTDLKSEADGSAGWISANSVGVLAAVGAIVILGGTVTDQQLQITALALRLSGDETSILTLENKTMFQTSSSPLAYTKFSSILYVGGFDNVFTADLGGNITHSKNLQTGGTANIVGALTSPSIITNSITASTSPLVIESNTNINGDVYMQYNNLTFGGGILTNQSGDTQLNTLSVNGLSKFNNDVSLPLNNLTIGTGKLSNTTGDTQLNTLTINGLSNVNAVMTFEKTIEPETTAIPFISIKKPYTAVAQEIGGVNIGVSDILNSMSNDLTEFNYHYGGPSSMASYGYIRTKVDGNSSASVKNMEFLAGGNVYIPQGTFTCNGSFFNGDMVITGNLTVNGNIKINGDLTVTGTTTLNNLVISGTETINNITQQEIDIDSFMNQFSPGFGTNNLVV